jgi:hypothetical protein
MSVIAGQNDPPTFTAPDDLSDVMRPNDGNAGTGATSRDTHEAPIGCEVEARNNPAELVEAVPTAAPWIRTAARTPRQTGRIMPVARYFDLIGSAGHDATIRASKASAANYDLRLGDVALIMMMVMAMMAVMLHQWFRFRFVNSGRRDDAQSHNGNECAKHERSPFVFLLRGTRRRRKVTQPQRHTRR